MEPNLFVRSKPVKDPQGYALWALRHRHCAACGMPHEVASRRFGFHMTTHHIVKSGRSDEPANLLRLCWRCHQSAENIPTLTAGVRFPILPLAACLWLKRESDPDEFDFERIRILLHRNPPDPEPPDPVFLLARTEWTRATVPRLGE